MNLYEIKAELEQAIAEMLGSVDEETGEVDQAAYEKFNELNEAKADKLDAAGAYYKNLMAEIKMLKDEEQSLKERREAKEKKAENLKKYLSDILDGEKFESTRVAYSFRKSESVEIVDMDLLPETYIKVHTDIKPDKTKIKEELKAGHEVPGAFLKTSNNLQIK